MLKNGKTKTGSKTHQSHRISHKVTVIILSLKELMQHVANFLHAPVVAIALQCCQMLLVLEQSIQAENANKIQVLQNET